MPSRRSCGNMGGVGLRVPCGGACEGRFGQVRVSRSMTEISAENMGTFGRKHGMAL